MLGRSKAGGHEHPKRFATGGPGRRHYARGHAHLGLHRQSVPAQFDRRDCAQPRPGARAFAGRDRASFERILFRLCGGPNSGRGGARPLRPAAVPGGGRRDHHDRRRCVRRRGKPGDADPRPGPAWAWDRRLARGVARRLRPPVSTRAFCHAHRTANRFRDGRRSACDRPARLFHRDHRLARQLPRGRRLHGPGRIADRGRRQGRAPRAAGTRRCARACPASFPCCAGRRSGVCSS